MVDSLLYLSLFFETMIEWFCAPDGAVTIAYHTIKARGKQGLLRIFLKTEEIACGICGVICEYNPFHRGHEKQLRQIRAALGEDTAVVCLMSGNFVQRGEPAVFDKRVSAQAAVLSGGEPRSGAAGHQGAFLGRRALRAGAWRFLTGSGCADTLAFGCESGRYGRACWRRRRSMCAPAYDAGAAGRFWIPA